jgi:hypothetical protein
VPTHHCPRDLAVGTRRRVWAVGPAGASSPIRRGPVLSCGGVTQVMPCWLSARRRGLARFGNAVVGRVALEAAAAGSGRDRPGAKRGRGLDGQSDAMAEPSWPACCHGVSCRRRPSGGCSLPRPETGGRIGGDSQQDWTLGRCQPASTRQWDRPAYGPPSYCGWIRVGLGFGVLACQRRASPWWLSSPRPGPRNCRESRWPRSALAIREQTACAVSLVSAPVAPVGASGTMSSRRVLGRGRAQATVRLVGSPPRDAPVVALVCRGFDLRQVSCLWQPRSGPNGEAAPGPRRWPACPVSAQRRAAGMPAIPGDNLARIRGV